MYRDLFLNGNVTTFIYSEVAPWQRIFPPIYLPMAIWPYGYIAGMENTTTIYPQLNPFSND